MKNIIQYYFWKALRFVSPKFALDSEGQANELTIHILLLCFVCLLLLFSIYIQRESYFDLVRYLFNG